jgi:hypothetical protein
VFTIGNAVDVNPVIRFPPHMCNMRGGKMVEGLIPAASPRVDISNTCNVGHKIGVSVPLLTCSRSA